MLSRLIRWSLLTVVLSAVAAPGLAQPVEPPPTPAAPTAPPSDVPPPAPTPPVPPPLAPPAPEPPPVEAAPLPTLDLFSTGRDTGLGLDLWKGSSADIARQVIPALAQAPLSPAGAALARRVLASAATAPDGAGADVALAAARARALLALGDAADADTILDHTAGVADSAELSKTAAEVALITDQTDKACRIGDALSTDRGAIYWLRLRAFCQARAGQLAAAQLTFTLAVQQGPDAVYSRMMTVILNSAGDPGPASLRNGLDYALSRQLKLDLGPALAGAPPAIAAQIAPPAPPAPSVLAPGAPPPPPPVEADVIAALRTAKGLTDYEAAARAQLPAIVRLVQINIPLAYPVQLAAAALAAGDLTTAKAIRAALTGDTVPGASIVDLAILDAALSLAAGKPDAATLDRLCERGVQGEAKDRARAQAAAAILVGFGAPMSGEDRGEYVGFNIAQTASAAQLLALQAAADGGVKGDTALISLSIAETSGDYGPAPGDRAWIVRALSRTGLSADAQALAVEGLLGLRAR